MTVAVVCGSKLPEERRIRPPLKTRAGFRPEAWLPKPIAPHSQAGDHEFREPPVRTHTARPAPVLPTPLGETDTARRFVARRFRWRDLARHEYGTGKPLIVMAAVTGHPGRPGETLVRRHGFSTSRGPR